MAENDDASDLERGGQSEQLRFPLEWLDAISDGAVLLDADAGWLQVNRACREMFGAGRPIWSDDSGQPLSVDHQPELRAVRGEQFVGRFLAAAEGGSSRQFEIRGRQVRGHSRVLAIIFIREMTSLPPQVVTKRYLDQFGHELRTALTPLKGYLQLMSKVDLTSNIGQQRFTRYAEATLQQVRRIEELTELWLGQDAPLAAASSAEQNFSAAPGPAGQG